jgi:hypothetical protein
VVEPEPLWAVIREIPDRSLRWPAGSWAFAWNMRRLRQRLRHRWLCGARWFLQISGQFPSM